MRPGFEVFLLVFTGIVSGALCSGRKLFTAMGAAGCDDLAAAGGRHAGAEAMTACPHELGWLVGALHLFKHRGVRPFLILSDNRSGLANDYVLRRIAA